jgi:tRNA-Thr(GGU) m(6)t(6)A37 methyltransferase TsaA
MKLELKPIGIVHSPYKNRYKAPRQRGEEVSEIIVFDEYEEGPKDIEGFSHLHILYYLHKSRGYSLSVKTPWDAEPHGLFATRSSHRHACMHAERGELRVEKKCTYFLCTHGI